MPNGLDDKYVYRHPPVVDIKETTRPPRTSVLRSRETAMRSAEGTFISLTPRHKGTVCWR